MTGSVTDANGAAVTGASVAVTNQATNLSRTVSTNEQGIYSFSSLPVGAYELEIKAAGFITYKVASIVLNVGQTLVVNAAVQVAVACCAWQKWTDGKKHAVRKTDKPKYFIY